MKITERTAYSEESMSWIKVQRILDNDAILITIDGGESTVALGDLSILTDMLNAFADEIRREEPEGE